MVFVTHITGRVCFKSPFDIIKAGEIISKELLGGLNFTGDKGYFEEIPGMMLAILGLQISIQEIEPSDESSWTTYAFSVVPTHSVGDLFPTNHGKLDHYLYSLFESKFRNSKEIIPIFDF